MTGKRVVVLDYGSGNLRSAERAVARTGAEVTVTGDLGAAAAADGLFVPGVGAYAACMAGIDELGAGPMIAERVAAGRPVIGVCVGMQIMFDSGVEHGLETKGLGLLPGAVTRLSAERIPHMGWNTVDVAAGSALLSGLGAATRFYFVHSYAASDLDALHRAGAAVTTASHDEPFAAVVELGALSVAQFHPEKSADAGFALLRNWVAGLLRAVSKERAKRRAERLAVLEREKATRARKVARRQRRRQLVRRLTPNPGRAGRLHRRSRAERIGIVLVPLAAAALIWLLVPDLALKIVLTIVIVLSLPALVVVFLGRRA